MIRSVIVFATSVLSMNAMMCINLISNSIIIPIKIIRAICEKIFIELFKNNIKTSPPKTARGTVSIIING